MFSVMLLFYLLKVRIMKTNKSISNQFDTCHCLFEQSGAFKNAFRELGFQSYDYDISNTFGQTDFVVDLFNEIEKCYSCNTSIFDSFLPGSLVFSFFPCIYFESMQASYYSLQTNNLIKKSFSEKIDIVVERIKKREYYYTLLFKLLKICHEKKLRLIIENPATPPHYLLFTQNFPKATYIDYDRRKSGDYFKKPTAYWCFNVNFIQNFTPFKNKTNLKIKFCRPSSTPGCCSIERSKISPEYAYNFICDHLLGFNPKFPQQQNLF